MQEQIEACPERTRRVGGTARWLLGANRPYFSGILVTNITMLLSFEPDYSCHDRLPAASSLIRITREPSTVMAVPVAMPAISLSSAA
jgi:hypothetical protein